MSLQQEATGRLPLQDFTHAGVPENVAAPLEYVRDTRGYMLRRLLLLADVIAFAGAFGVAKVYDVYTGAAQFGAIGTDLLVLVSALPIWVMISHANRLYHVDTHRAEQGVVDEAAAIFQTSTLASWLGLLVVSATGVADVSVRQMFAFWLAIMALSMLLRATARAYARRNDWYLQNALLVGSRPQFSAMAARILRHPEYRINTVACVDLETPTQGDPLGTIAVLPSNTDVIGLVRELDVDRVIFASSSACAEAHFDLVHDLAEANVQVDLVPHWFAVLGVRPDMHEFEGTPLLTVPCPRLSRSSIFLKRALDVVASAAALVALAPFLFACTLAIKLTSSGPIFFRQERVGRDERRFQVLKFRSMYEHADDIKDEMAALNYHGGGTREGMFKIREDPRVTRVGRWLRRTSVDELPQLINILRGEMSLVGPRPLIENEDRQVEGRLRRRLHLTPGLTGLWQVNGRSDIPFSEMVGLDFLYVSNWSLWGDVKILMRTVSAVYRGSGAY